MNPITMNLVADDIIRFALHEDMNAGDLSTESVCPARPNPSAPPRARRGCSSSPRARA